MLSQRNILRLNNVVRNLHRYKRTKINVSVRKTDRITDEEKKIFHGKDLDEDDLEGSFHDLGLSYNEHRQEVRLMKEQEKYHIVRQKYFKEKLPNFLTLYDKQQMKELHEKDANYWTYEKLSEGFPATPDIVKKVIKANWSITNENRGKSHDMKVQENWALFKQGKIELPQDLVEHLNKFTNRSLNFNYVIKPKENKINLPDNGEFGSIIESYKQLKGENTTNESYKNVEGEEEVKPLKETYVEKSKLNSQPITLSELEKTLERKAEYGRQLSEQENLIVLSKHEVKEVADISQATPVDSISKYTTKSNKLATIKKQDYSHLIYPEKISIPKEKRHQNALYKLNDCYYDSKGAFLYRVPGMS